jgi:periplasmic protein TonB
MFDGIGVSERSRKPWTVAVSCAGQSVMIGLAIMAPLVTTEALPHERFAATLAAPAPPPPPPRRTPQTEAKLLRAALVRLSRAVLQAPSTIPVKVVMVLDSEPSPQAAGGVEGGVPGGTGEPARLGTPVFAGGAAPPPPPPPPVKKTEPKPRPVPVGGQVQLAKLVFGPRPVYPALAKQARISGAVRLEAVIARDGSVENLRYVSGHPMLVEAAIAAVEQWRFQPTYLNGVPVEVATDIEVNFKLQP